MKKRIVKYWSIAIGVVVILHMLLAHFYFPRMVTEVRNPIVKLFKKDRIYRNAFGSKVETKTGRLISITSPDGIKLEAYETFAKTIASKGTIILLHGIRANKNRFKSLSRNLANSGYNSIALDLRAHGNSEGTHCTFGVKEKEDVSAVIDFILNNNENTSPIGVWGQSLGGAIGLQALAADERLAFGIIESTFSDFRSVTHEYSRLYAGYDIEWITDYVVDRAGEIAGFDVEDASPNNFCHLIEQPVFLAHGERDHRISLSHAGENFSLLKNPSNEFLVVKNAWHTNLHQAGGVDYYEKVLKFIEDNI